MYCIHLCKKKIDAHRRILFTNTRADFSRTQMNHMNMISNVPSKLATTLPHTEQHAAQDILYTKQQQQQQLILISQFLDAVLCLVAL